MNSVRILLLNLLRVLLLALTVLALIMEFYDLPLAGKSDSGVMLLTGLVGNRSRMC